MIRPVSRYDYNVQQESHDGHVQALRDVPRMVTMIERGQYDAKALVGRVYRPNQMREAIEVAANRSAITSVIDFT